ncbi:enoyl-CoA hydratase/isomerase family protein [Streptomyces sp. JJ66]|uniref:enoyl-CoA hydratase-related protein n=1 Tax=Streptomyces sp. JJ66 TaxID=2803843 RepID=UPI001C596B6C|nr:enoyl-CoA hydratase-related protein [Streptomyces sp. JJ66]MBW1602946.1 enoyl-CoA hydratase/isomerase family protein [Streptomyces sp. JJ66]
MADTVRYDVTEGLATIVLNRPDAMNALDTELKESLRDTLRQAADDATVRAVLLTGSGRAFCVGQDLKEHVSALQESGGDALKTVGRHYNPITLAIAAMPKPVVAAVNGVAAGAGAGFAFAADWRVAADTAAFHTSFAGVALSTDSGVAWTLPRLVGPSRASDLLLFPRTVRAEEALALGLVNRVVPAQELAAEAGAVARELASGPTGAYAAMKEALAYGASHSLAETLDKEAALQLRVGGSADHRIAVEAFVRKEPPRFTGR